MIADDDASVCEELDGPGMWKTCTHAEVLSCIREGKTNAEAANDLGVSINLVQRRRRKLRDAGLC